MKSSHYQSLYDHELTHWWYKVRRSLVIWLVRTYLHKDHLRILDLGCGTGALMKDMEKYGEVYGLDMSEQAVKFCKQRGLTNVRQGDMTQLPFEDNFFDLVLALDVLEHVQDDGKAVCEIRRVTKQDGTVIVFVPAFMVLWSITDVLSEHFRRYVKRDLIRVLETGGLRTVRSSYFNFFLFLPILSVRLLVRILHIKMENENNVGNSWINRMLYCIFFMETLLLRTMSFPFGVSIMAVCKKAA